MMKRVLSSAGLTLLFLATTSAFAAEGYVTGNVSLRAGPDASYPAVVRLRAGTTVDIDGCVDGWSWCDVSTGDDRGWVSGNYLQEEYEGRRVLVPSYGVRIGIPILSFVFADYWGEHYRQRSWYGNRERWSHVRPQYHSAYIRSDSHTGSYHAHDTRTNSVSQESRTPLYRANQPSRRGEVLPQRSAGSATMNSQPLPTRRDTSIQGDRAHAQSLQHHADASTLRVPTQAATGAAPGSGNQHANRRVEQPRTVAEHTMPAASPRGMREKAAHEPARDNGKGTDKGNDKGNKGKDNKVEEQH